MTITPSEVLDPTTLSEVTTGTNVIPVYNSVTSEVKKITVTDNIETRISANETDISTNTSDISDLDTNKPDYTNWASYTPTVSTGIFTSTEGFWRIVGDTIEVRIKSGPITSNGSGIYTWTLPSGYQLDTSKMPTITPSVVAGDSQNQTLLGPVGKGIINTQGSAWYSGGSSASNTNPLVFMYSNTTVCILTDSYINNSRSVALDSSVNLTSVLATFQFDFSIPVTTV